MISVYPKTFGPFEIKKFENYSNMQSLPLAPLVPNIKTILHNDVRISSPEGKATKVLLPRGCDLTLN